MRTLCLVALVLVAGSATANPTFNEGMAGVNSGNYTLAYDRFQRCFSETGHPVCANNAGYAAEKIGDLAAARSWYTLAARHGIPNAVGHLTRLGFPVPAPDLSNAGASSVPWDVILQGAANGMQESARQLQQSTAQDAERRRQVQEQEQMMNRILDRQRAQDNFDREMRQPLPARRY